MEPAPTTIELTHFRTGRRAVTTIEGWIEGESKEFRRLLLGGGMLELSDLDPRLDGSAAIPHYRSGMTRFELKVNGPVSVEGRPLEVGERVRITTGGEISYSRAD